MLTIRPSRTWAVLPTPLPHTRINQHTTSDGVKEVLRSPNCFTMYVARLDHLTTPLCKLPHPVQSGFPAAAGGLSVHAPGMKEAANTRRPVVAGSEFWAMMVSEPLMHLGSLNPWSSDGMPVRDRLGKPNCLLTEPVQPVHRL